jgi:uncharacterized Zn-binding protein involved in type VI secretion
MRQPAAKHGDRIAAVDIHIVIVPGVPAVPTPVPHPFSGVIDGGLSGNVNVDGRAVATVGSTATNQPVHVPIGGPFARPPANRGTITTGSATVRINGRQAARNGDRALTCNDPVDLPVGTVVAAGTVLVG